MTSEIEGFKMGEIEDLIFVYFLINIPNCLIYYVATLYIEVVLWVRHVLVSMSVFALILYNDSEIEDFIFVYVPIHTPNCGLYHQEEFFNL